MLLKSTEDGRVITTDAKMINKVLRLDLSEERDRQEFNISGTTEITFNIIETPISLFLNNCNEDNRMTIVRPCSIGTETGRFYISNTASSGEIEIWLWR